MSKLPISIVIPMYNRAVEIRRALHSCLSQGFRDFEVVVVDDCSCDGSATAVRAFTDPRVRLVRHERNRGVCPARNTGVDHARGDWILFLDSDDELLPGALDTMAGRMVSASEAVERLIFMYALDTGGFSPRSPLQSTVWNYVAYLDWLEHAEGSTDYFNCVRRRTFKSVRFPAGRAYEALYHLDFAQQHYTQCCPEVVALVHSDSANRSINNTAHKRRRDAHDGAAGMDELLRRHGPALRAQAPGRYRQMLKMAASNHAAAGHRVRSALLALRYLRHQPLSPEGWLQLLLGMAGPRIYTWAAALKNPRPRAAVSARMQHA